MRKSAWAGTVVVVVMLVWAMAGCGPMKVEKLEEVKAGESAFLISLEGDTKAEADVFGSEEMLEAKKVFTKRISLEQRKVTTGRLPWHYQWQPTQRLIRVSRKPITREWTADVSAGASKTDQAIYVESADSIGFSVGINITVSVTEKDAAKFVCNFAEKPLEMVVDENIRGFVQSVLSEEFGAKPLTECIKAKKEVSDTLQKKTKEAFAMKGITVDYVSLAQGLTFENIQVQEALDRKFTAEMSVMAAQEEAKAQEERNKMAIAKAKAEGEAAKEFEKNQEAQMLKMKLEIEKTKAEKWSGMFPANIVPENSSFLFNLSTGNLAAPKRPAQDAATGQPQAPSAAAPVPAPTPN